MSLQKSQHESLIELIFSKCTLVYGRDFLNRWEGQDLSEVMADWERELGGVLDNPQAVKYGLEHLPPNRPPNVLQFRDLCIARPDPMPLMLPPPKADPAVVKQVMRSLKLSQSHPKAWAQRLREREEAGDKLTITQRQMWREALKYELQESEHE